MPQTTAPAEATRTVTFIYRCTGKCKRSRRVLMNARRYRAGYGRWDVSYSAANPADHGLQCCGRYMRGDRLQASLRPEVKCNARCTHAVGFICDCSCAGKNHASGGGMFTELLAAA
jgi:hypothetical protein